MKDTEHNRDFEFHYVRYGDLRLGPRGSDAVHDLAKSQLLDACPIIRDDFPCFFCLRAGTNDLACWVRAIPDNLEIGGTEMPWAWFGALFTKEEYRGRGLATTLIDQTRRIVHADGMAWGGVFSSDVALKIYRTLGYTMPGFASRFLFVKRMRPLLKAHIDSALFSKVGSTLISPLNSLYYHLGRLRNVKHTRGLSSERFAPPPQAALQELAASFPHSEVFSFDNRPTVLAWKTTMCAAREENECAILKIRDDRAVRDLGYAVLRSKYQSRAIGDKYKDFKLMTLMDFGLGIHDDRSCSGLLDKVGKVFWESDAEILEVISSSPHLGQAARRMGMVRVGKGMSFTFSLPGKWQLDAAAYGDVRNWHLVPFCGDGFSF
jgi:GNAT superfamily N-acetyltransferase